MSLSEAVGGITMCDSAESLSGYVWVTTRACGMRARVMEPNTAMKGGSRTSSSLEHMDRLGEHTHLLSIRRRALSVYEQR